jgi:hypothetical protein
MIKKGQIGDQLQDHNRGELRYHPEASWEFAREPTVGVFPVITQLVT